jgi:hypothetical protein
MKTLNDWLSALDAYAASHPDGAYEVYAAQSLVLHIWNGNGIPDPEWWSEFNPYLAGLWKSFPRGCWPQIKAALQERMKQSWMPAAVVPFTKTDGAGA